MPTSAPSEQVHPAILESLKAYVADTGDDWNYILPTALHVALMKPHEYCLLDIRRPEDYAKGHIEGAENIFWLDLLSPGNLARLPRNKRIILICYVGHTASQSLVMLRLLGFDVLVLKFGMGRSPAVGVPIAGWENYGFETVR